MIILSGVLSLVLSSSVSAASFGEQNVARFVSLKPERQLVLAENGTVNCEVVSPDGTAPAARFAAKELQKYLSESIGAPVPLVKKAGTGKVSILVGTGADISELPRDGFIIRAAGSRIIIAGRDDTRYTPGADYAPWGDYCERATLFGVYDFLERFLGAKFVFPGDAGTVVPKHRTLKVPAMDILERPDNIVRSISWSDGIWFDGSQVNFNRKLNNYRLRMQTAYIPNCHGLGRMAYIERFGKTHPEYFALRSNGTRSNNLSEHMGGQLCFSSGIREEIYQDAKAWLSGQSAKSRNMWHNRYKGYVWDHNAVQPGFFNIMPQDGMRPCQCAECKKLAITENWASDQVWQMTCDAAKRMKKEGIRGYLTQMAYGSHAAIPPFDIPDNVLVMVAPFGPWAAARPGGWRRQLDFIQSWKDKVNGKVWLWTYVTKYAGTKILNVPCSTPEAVGRFYTEIQKNIFGSFMESSSDYAAFQFFNWYVFSKKMWDSETDTAKLLSETYSALYGAGAGEMEKFFRHLENIWLTKITGKVVMSSAGPTAVPPTDYELWNEIYTEKEMAALNAMLSAAEKAAAKDHAVLNRIGFIRRNYYDILKNARSGFFETQRSVSSLKQSVKQVPDQTVTLDGKLDEKAWKEAPVLYLGGLNGALTEVRTKVRILRDNGNLYISYECEEPEMADGFVQKLSFDDPDIWRNDSVEIFLNPAGKRSGYFQWMVSRNGDCADLRQELKDGVPVHDFKWNSGAVVRTALQKDSWTMEMAVPLAGLGELDEENIIADFTRSRVLKTNRRATVYHSWSPFVRRYGDIGNFGSLTFKDAGDGNLLEGGDFDVVKNGRFFGKWGTSADFVLPKNDYIALDGKTFLFGGKSLRMTNPGGKNLNVSQYIRGIRKGGKYRITFSVKADMRDSANGGIFIQFNDGSNFSWPRPEIKQSIPWTTYTMTFVARRSSDEKSSCYIRLYNYLCKATVWFDGIRVEAVE